MTKWLFAAALAVACAQAGAATWNVFVSDGGDERGLRRTFFDADSVVRQGDAVTVSFEAMHDVEVEPSRQEGAYKSLDRRTFHCGARTLETTDAEAFDWDGNRSVQPGSDGHPVVVPRGSDEEHWLDAACAATFPRPQPGGSFVRVPQNDPDDWAIEYFRGERARLAADERERPPESPWAAREDCTGLHFRYAASLGQLPVGLLVVMEQGGALAERGQRFSVTDVIDPRFPRRRRFEGAIVSDSRAFVAMVRGGYAQSFAIWDFRREGEHWTGKPRWAFGAVSTLRGLLSTTCKQYAPPPRAGWPVRPRIECSVNDERSITVNYVDSWDYFNYTLDRRAVARGIARRGRFVASFGGQDREPTLDEVAGVYALLESGRASRDNRCPTATLDEFMQALSGHEPPTPAPTASHGSAATSAP